MSILNTNWQTSRNENLEGLIDSVGVKGQDKKEWLESKTTFRITKAGDGYQFTSTPDAGKKSEYSFKDGVEFEETIGEAMTAKSVIKFNGDSSYTHVQKFANGTIFTMNYQLTSDGLVCTTTTNKWDGSAKIYYKSV